MRDFFKPRIFSDFYKRRRKTGDEKWVQKSAKELGESMGQEHYYSLLRKGI